ncbi:MAG: nitrogenase cofactor biosynthesis protein NifB [Methanoculleaceae archaeon]
MRSEQYRTAVVDGREIPFDPEQLRRVREHPCYSEKACHLFGRCHLPVAPYCNIRCNYCDRRYDCVNESRPGVTSRVIRPKEALELTRKVLDKYPYIKVIAVAGPGEPMANEETFETFRLVRDEFPHIILCTSTNGLLLAERIDTLEELGVGNVTVTLNAVDPDIGKDIYSYVNYDGTRYTGREAAEILLSQQLKGIEEAVKRKMLVKINCVHIPTINDHHIPDIARKVGEMGVYLFNLIPVIPLYKFSHITPPTPRQKEEMQDLCSQWVKQMRHCRRCRADAIGRLGEDVQSCIYSEYKNGEDKD